eukprot:109156-Hanusia_phi.AAC.1
MILRATGPTMMPPNDGRILSTAAPAGNFGVPRSHRDCQIGNFKPDSTRDGRARAAPAGWARRAARQYSYRLSY